jgi:hypothetical protein
MFDVDVFAEGPPGCAFVRLEGKAEFAAEAATPPPRTSGFEGWERATRMVSEEMDEELCSDAASSIRILSPKPGGMAMAGLHKERCQESGIASMIRRRVKHAWANKQFCLCKKCP